MRRAAGCLLLLLLMIGSAACQGGAAQPVDCSGACGPGRSEVPRAQAGVIDLRTWDFARRGLVPLDGEWLWHWQKLHEPQAFLSSPPPSPTGVYQLPRMWNGLVVDGQPIGADGFATFRLQVLLPKADVYSVRVKLANAASSLWVDGRRLTQSGQLSAQPAGYREHGQVQVVHFYADQAAIQLTLQLANFAFFRGGPRASLWFGPAIQMQQHRDRALLRETALSAACFIIGWFQIALFVLRRQDRGPLYLGIFCLLFTLWNLLQGERLLIDVLPRVPYDWFRKVEYLALASLVPTFALFLDSLFKDAMARLATRLNIGVGGGFSVLVLLTPSSVYTRALIALQIWALLALIYSWPVIIQLVRKGVLDAKLFACGYLFFSIGLVVDIVYTVIQPLAFVPISAWAFLLLIFTDAVLLARKSARAYTMTETQAQALERISRAYYRFVPQAFLQLLGKRDITTVELGDQTEATMTVLFADVRGFTALSEQMTPEENFAFINRLLRHLGPLIRDNNGFIDKYLGDGIMALFPAHPGDALRAASSMRAALRRFNLSRQAQAQPPIRMGIGVHTGRLMLGTVGEPERMDGTVIADAVNTTARLESLTKRYGVTILASAETIHQSGWMESHPMNIRRIAKVRVKGKTTAMELFEVFDQEAVVASDSRASLPPSATSAPSASSTSSATSTPSASSLPAADAGESVQTLQLKQATRAEFEEGLQQFQEGHFVEAARIFGSLCELNPTDRPARYYLQRSSEWIAQGTPPNWDGSEALTEK